MPRFPVREKVPGVMFFRLRGVPMHHPEPTGRPAAAIVLSSVLGLLALVLSLVFVAAAAAAECDPMRQDCGDGDPPPPTITYPDTTLTAKPDALTNQTRPTFTYKADMANSFYECRFAASASESWKTADAFACGTAPTTSTLTSYQPASAQADGTHHFHVRACKGFYDEDTGGDVTRCDPSPAKASYTIDTVGPEATFTSGPAHNARIRTLPSYAFTGAEAGSKGYYCWVDNVLNTSCTSPQTFAGNLAQGTHNVQVRAFDALGNAGPMVTRSFVWDTVAPATTLTVPALTNDSTPTLQYAIPVDGGGTGSFACQLDGAAVPCVGDGAGGAYTPPAPLADGQHTFRVQAADATGNVGAWSDVATFTVDTTAPAIGPMTFDGSAKTVAFSSPDAVAGWRCKVGAAPFADCTAPFAVAALAPGTHVVTVQARDAAGNTAEKELTLAIAAPAKDEPAPASGGDAQIAGSTAPAAPSTSTASSVRPPAAAVPSAAAKKAKPRCRIVKKKVRGTTRKVKVCAKKKARKTAKKARRA